jgi:hypothetical protein
MIEKEAKSLEGTHLQSSIILYNKPVIRTCAW